jgi:hypothetical protein
MSSKPTIPEWQRASVDSPAASPDHKEAQQPVEAATPTEDDIPAADIDQNPSEDTDLLEQASLFLEDPAIRDAPREKKAAFLESKGVRDKDIESLLYAETQESGHVDLEEIGERVWSTVSLLSQHRKRMMPKGSWATYILWTHY